jgi:hypothetical protein
LSFRQWFFALAALIIVVFVAWGESLKGYFIADDVWHVPLVYRALNGEPSLIWRQFLSPYSFHECLYLMYRPLTDISFALDCCLWKGNAWGYHLTNVIWHAISTCLVFALTKSLLSYVLLRDIPKEEYSPNVLLVIPSIVSLIFAVYPGHAEPICWALPRIDSIGGAFTFASFICSLEYFDKRDQRWFIAACVAFVFGLTIKEMSAAIPLVVIALYLIAAPGSGRKQDPPLLALFRRMWSGFLLCWPMFAILVIYIAVRGVALGSLLGGYQGTIGAGLNASFVTRLFSVDAYWRLLHPINFSVLGTDSIQDLIIRAIYFLIALLVLFNQKTPCAKARFAAAGKYLFMLLILILPCLQIWGVTEGLIGARLAYTLCVPFLLAVVVLIYPISSDNSRLVRVLRGCAGGLLWATFVLFFLMSMQYARTWRDATSQMNTIRAQIEEHVAYLPAEKKLVVLGLPTGVSGFCAFYTIDFLPGLLMPPLSKSDINSRVICVDGTPTNDRVINISLLKELANHSDKYEFILWRELEKKFVVIGFPSLETQRPFEEPEIEALGNFARYQSITSGHEFFENRRSGNDIVSYLLTVNEPIAPLDFDLLELKISCGRDPAAAPKAPPNLGALSVSETSALPGKTALQTSETALSTQKKAMETASSAVSSLPQKNVSSRVCDELLAPERHPFARVSARYFEPLTDVEFAKKFNPDPVTFIPPPTNTYLSETVRAPAPSSREASEFFSSMNGDDVVVPDSTNQVLDIRRGRYGFLSWLGQSDSEGTNGLPIHFPVFFDDGIKTYRIHLTQYKSWLCSGSSRAFRIDLPGGGDIKLVSALFKSSTDYIPLLSFNGQGELNSSGLIDIKDSKLAFSYDVSKIPGAKSAFLEVSNPYYEFHVQPHSYRQSARSKYASYTQEFKDLTSRFVLPPRVVKKAAYYQFRIAAVDSSGNIVGSFSDPITLSNFRLP